MADFTSPAMLWAPESAKKEPAIRQEIWYGGAPPEGGVETDTVSKRNLAGKKRRQKK
jgi:hypothetical protein